jgi:carboxyl-terminal processing protease
VDLAPRDIFVGALRQLEKEALPVVVSQGESPPTVVVQVNASQRTFRIDDVLGVWDVAARLREVFVFLHAQLQSDS